MNVFTDNSLTIGNTPLVKLNKLTDKNIFVKVESRNPANSVKCRIGANMIWEAEKAGTLKPGMTLVEPTSGNTGIALAFVGAARGYNVVLTMPHTMSMERRNLIKALGATIIITDAAKGIALAIQKAQELVDTNPETHVMLQQFENPANPAVHERTTGPEIWTDTDGSIDVLVSGVGTGGTITGVSRYIKQKKKILSVAVEPVSSPQIKSALAGTEASHAPHKIQGIGTGFLPKNLDLSMVDQSELVSDEEAFEYAHRLMKEEGILAGISGGAATAVAVRLAEQPEHAGKTFVVILPDSGERYLSSPLFEGAFTEDEVVSE